VQSNPTQWTGTSPEYSGVGAMAVFISTGGTVVFKPGGGGFVEQDGSLGIKWPWWHDAPGTLRITGRGESSSVVRPPPGFTAYIAAIAFASRSASGIGATPSLSAARLADKNFAGFP
jgi:hypothetical protein